MERCGGAIEGDDIAPDPLEIEPDLLVSTGHDYVGAQTVSHHVERLAQRCARVFLVEFRPEQGEQAVTTVEAAWGGCGEIGKQGDAPGLSEGASHLAAVCVTEAHSAKHAQLDHPRSLRRAAASRGEPNEGGAVTARRDGRVTGA